MNSKGKVIRNAINKLLLWASTLFSAWLFGRGILWNLLGILIPAHKNIWGDDISWVIPLEVIGEYEYNRKAIAGILVLLVGTLILSYNLDRISSNHLEQLPSRKFWWLSKSTIIMRVMLAGYFVFFQANLESYWHILVFPDSRIIFTIKHLEILIALLIIIWVVGYSIIFEPWKTFIPNWRISNLPCQKPKFLLVGRVVNYLLVILLLVWTAVPYPQIGYTGDAVSGVLGIYLIYHCVRKKGCVITADSN